MWLPIPGLRAALAEGLRTDPPSGVAICVDHLKYSLQFIPVVQAVNDVLADDGGARSHEWCRLLLQSGEYDLVIYGTVSLRNAMGNGFMEGLFVPRRWRDRWFPVFDRHDRPERIVCAGYHFAIWAAQLPVESIRQIVESVDESIHAFRHVSHLSHSIEVINTYTALRDCLACETAEGIAGMGGALTWMDVLTEPELRPELIYCLRELNSVIRDVESVVQASEHDTRLAAADHATETLRQLSDYVAAECFGPEKTLLKMIIERWAKSITKVRDEIAHG